jgi:hypothetical protein
VVLRILDAPDLLHAKLRASGRRRAPSIQAPAGSLGCPGPDREGPFTGEPVVPRGACALG